MRYMIYDGSQSGHCCFNFTIIDTSKPVMIGGEQYINNSGRLQYKEVCECLDEESAKHICQALNFMDSDLFLELDFRQMYAMHEGIVNSVNAEFNVLLKDLSGHIYRYTNVTLSGKVGGPGFKSSHVKNVQLIKA